MNNHGLLYKISSLPVKAFAIPVGQVKMGVQRQSPGFTASVYLNAFQISAERMRVMACRHSTTGSMLVLKHGIGVFSFWKVQEHGVGHLQKKFLFREHPQNCVVHK